MYLPKHFEETRPEALQALIGVQPMGLLIHIGADGPVANPLPFLLEPGGTPDSPGTLVCHVARANPLWREAAGQRVLVSFQGAEGYISPNWYPVKAEHGKVVPTWNYTLVQGRGTLQAVDDPVVVRGIVERLTARHEAAQPRPWAVGDAPPEFIEQMLRAIVGVRIPLDSLVGKLKLSQNRALTDRQGVVDGLAAQAGHGPAALREAMSATLPAAAEGAR